MIDQVPVEKVVAARLAPEDGDRHAPGPLAGEAPVPPGRDDPPHPVLPPPRGARRPPAGTHVTFRISARAFPRSPVLAMERILCFVARKMTGCLHRQQWGYE